MTCYRQGAAGGEEAEQNAGFQSLLTTYGAVMVGGRNFFKLMQNKEAALLFPGGAREVMQLSCLTDATSNKKQT